MTRLLGKAIKEVSKLDEQKQEFYAQVLLDQLEADRKWDESFANSQDALAKLADEALAEYRAGKTRPLDPDKL